MIFCSQKLIRLHQWLSTDSPKNRVYCSKSIVESSPYLCSIYCLLSSLRPNNQLADVRVELRDLNRLN